MVLFWTRNLTLILKIIVFCRKGAENPGKLEKRKNTFAPNIGLWGIKLCGNFYAEHDGVISFTIRPKISRKTPGKRNNDKFPSKDRVVEYQIVWNFTLNTTV